MTIRQGIFGDTSNFEQRYIRDYEQIAQVVASLRQLGTSIVLTSGSFDLVHEGHVRYLEQAKTYGDVLVVGVDSDDKIRARKGPDRPIVPEEERLRMLTHFRPVDIVALKNQGDAKWALIEAVRPDVLVATIDTYTDEEIARLEDGYCGRVEVLERMATMTTTARLRDAQLFLAARLEQNLMAAVPHIIAQTLEQGGRRSE